MPKDTFFTTGKACLPSTSLDTSKLLPVNPRANKAKIEEILIQTMDSAETPFNIQFKLVKVGAFYEVRRTINMLWSQFLTGSQVFNILH